MQEILFARHQGAGVQYDFEAEGVLEDPADIVIYQHDCPVASLYGLRYVAGTLSFPQRPGLLHYGSEDSYWVSMKIYSSDRLTWSHRGAMCVLQGMSIADVLGPSWAVIGGKPTLPGDPLPGIRSPILADVFDNPAQRPHTEIFRVVREALGLTA